MRITGDQSLVKKINKSIVLETVRSNHPISRAEISKLTGLNKGTVSTLVQELIDEELVYEIGTGQSSGGRKPVLLMFNKYAGYAIGVDLGVNYILACLVDLSGNILQEKYIPLEKTGVDDVMPLFLSCVQSLVDLAPQSRNGIVGIGVGVPGIVDDNGTLLFAPNLEWRDINLKQILMERFSVPVVVDNEANAGALGEKAFGSAAHYANIVYISVGIGIGAGVILNNELFKGASGFSGEVGHLTIEVNGKKCRCGNRGCWELYASEKALLESAKSLETAGAWPHPVDIHTLVEQADKGNTAAMHLFRQLGEYLGIGIANIINVFNPEVIIVGNRITKAKHWLHNPIKHMVEQRSLVFHRKRLLLEFSSLSTHSCVLGASWLAVTKFFSNAKVSVD